MQINTFKGQVMKTLKKQFIASFGGFKEVVQEMISNNKNEENLKFITAETQKLNGIFLIKINKTIIISEPITGAQFKLEYYDDNMELRSKSLIVEKQYENHKEMYLSLIESNIQLLKSFQMDGIFDKINKILFKIKLENSLKPKGIIEKKGKI